MNIIRRALRRIHDDQRGNIAAEVVIWAPILVLLIALLIVAGRTIHADNATQNAALSAARNASLSRDAQTAQDNAEAAARRAMANAGTPCLQLEVVIDTSGLNAPIGTTGIVSARVTCTVNLADVTVPGIPGTRQMTSTETSPVDAYRAR